MGICLSCLRGREGSKSSTRRRTEESQPLLDDSNDVFGGQFGSTEGQTDQLAQRRQQELSQVVQTTHDYFIDISSMGHPENVDAQADVSALRERIEKNTASFSIDLAKLREIPSEDHGLTPRRRDSSSPGETVAPTTSHVSA